MAVSRRSAKIEYLYPCDGAITPRRECDNPMAQDYNAGGERRRSKNNREAYEALAEVSGLVPPQALELEEVVLGALMLEKDSIIAVQEYLSADAFYNDTHKTIYRAIEDLARELQPIDLYNVT